ncbi:DUF6438 domain-containing protein [Sphingomonas psychrotolerans]|uniref:DUF6438 domain-containing protein n=1 Tax=Sphingomonas psychrotolerans TaxID=1327635 RepID=A0A2K8MLH6_9SPHN|nr:DUF6438 domain-containing protein [Sphingomonas psychrotolerans]ATY32609.1 hypothetical protein CVN68_12015 [Sphingomonas psychrotolerans]
MKQALGFGVMMLALGGCIPESRIPAGPVPIEGDSIRYETGPCFGRCPVYSVTVRPDGSGVFDGKRFTAVTGERSFTLSRAQYEAFAARLAPYRPASGEVRYAHGEANCTNAPTDMPSVDVRWTRAIGDSQGLYFYLGCRRGNEAVAEALGGAVELLPIEPMIGPRP